MKAKSTSERDTDVEWVAPLPGHWRRDFRLAEWLPGPVTRSCETWLLPALDQGFSAASLEEYGSGTKTGVVVVNGWCFATDPMPTKPGAMFTRAPIRMMRIAAAMAKMATRPELVENRIAEPGWNRYQRVELPNLEQRIATAAEGVATATPSELVATIDELAVATGQLMLGMVQAMGFAAKVEYALARFYADELAGKVSCTPLDLAMGFGTAQPTAAHAVTSLDWVEPTAGELGTTAAPDTSQRARLVETRSAAEKACREALAGDPDARSRFDMLIGMLARWIPIREQMAAEFTSAWPVMRIALERLGDALVAGGSITRPQDVFELSRDEVIAGLEGNDIDLRDAVSLRRAERDAQRRDAPPLSLGKPVRQWKQVDKILALLRPGAPTAAEPLALGVGTSSGRATGVARVILGPDDFDAFLPGEILVAPATAPAWTPLFLMAAGVVTDAGGPFAHTAVVAREYGIPAIVGTTDATRRITTGTRITIDAANGTVVAAQRTV